jgi:hypothetical protein
LRLQLEFAVKRHRVCAIARNRATYRHGLVPERPADSLMQRIEDWLVGLLPIEEQL